MIILAPMAQKDTHHAEGAPGWPATLEEIRALDRETRDERPPGDDRAPAPCKGPRGAR